MKIVKDIIKYDELPKDTEDVFVATGNAVIKSNDELVMGAGNALAMSKAFPIAPKEFGLRWKSRLEYMTLDKKPAFQKEYGFMMTKIEYNLLGVLQTKYHFKSPSSYELVTNSLHRFNNVKTFLDFVGYKYTYHIPMPGVSLGGLEKDKIIEIIKQFNFDERIIFYDAD